MTSEMAQSRYAGWEFQGPGHETVSSSLTSDENELGMFAMIDAFMQAAPYATAFITGGLKSSAADFVAQTQELRTSSTKIARSTRRSDIDNDSSTSSMEGSTKKLLKTEEGNNDNCESRSETPEQLTATTNTITRKRSTICLKRNLAFLLYGAICCGVAYEWIYNVAFPQIFGHETHLNAALAKTGTEIFIISPIFTIPTSYLITAAVTRTSYREAMEKYWHDVTKKRLLTTYCVVFGPFQVILFTLVPAYLRMTLASIVSFIWLMILSQVSSSKN